MYKKYNELSTENNESKERPTYPVMEIKSSEHKHDLLRKNPIVCVDVYGDWCQPCKLMEPSYAALAKKLSIPGKCMIVRENIELKLSQEFEITGIPALLIFFRGVLYKQFAGADLQPVEETIHALFGEMSRNGTRNQPGMRPEQPHPPVDPGFQYSNRQLPGQPPQPPTQSRQGQPTANYKQNYGAPTSGCVGGQCTYTPNSEPDTNPSPSFNTNNRNVRKFNNRRM
jgi:thioredoxin 1